MSLSPEKSQQIAKDCWKRGQQAFTSQNWDFAIEMFSQSVKLVPDNLMYRQLLRGAEHKKYNDNGSGARMAGTKLMGIRSRIKKARSKEEWETMAAEAEEGLKVNPWDATLNSNVGEAAAKLGWLEIGVFAYSEAIKQDPENIPYLKALGDLHLEKRNYDEAANLWSKVYKLDPHDGDARQRVANIHVMKTTDHGGYDDAESTQDVKAGKQSAYEEIRNNPNKQDANVVNPGDDPIVDLQWAIRKEPDNLNNYLKLADLYRRDKSIDKAEEILQKAVKLSNNDADVREQLEDVQLDKMRLQHDLAVEKYRAAPEDGALKERRQSLARQLLKREIQIFTERIERYPKDSRLKFELAKRYKRIKQWSKAIPLLQQASADNRMECEVLVSLGECFINDGKVSIGERQLSKALPKINPQDNPELFKQAHYMSARLAERKGEREKAEDHYQEIIGIDYNYLDVEQRFNAIQSGEAGQPPSEKPPTTTTTDAAGNDDDDHDIDAA